MPDVIASLYGSEDPTGFSVAWSSVRTPGSTTGNVYTMGLSAAPETAANATALTTTGGYSARVVDGGATNRRLLVFVKDLDIFGRWL